MGNRGAYNRITFHIKMMKAYTIVKQEIEALFGVQGGSSVYTRGRCSILLPLRILKKLASCGRLSPWRIGGWIF